MYVLALISLIWIAYKLGKEDGKWGALCRPCRPVHYCLYYDVAKKLIEVAKRYCMAFRLRQLSRDS